MYQNQYVIEQISRQYVNERQNEARNNRRASLAQIVRRGLDRLSR